MAALYKHPRGTKAALDTLAAANGLVVGVAYWLTDKKRLAIASAVGAYDFTTPRGISSFCGGAPTASEVVGGGLAPYSFTLSATNSSAKALVAATASTVFTIKLNGGSIGSITFAAAGTTGTVTYSSTAVAIGDNITIHGPATPDATLADITFMLKD